VIALVWAAAAALPLVVVGLLVLRSRHEPLLQLGDGGTLDAALRRTRLLWGTLAGALVAVLVVFAVQARAQPEAAPLLAPGSDAIIVVDLSGSALPSSEGISRVLLTLTRDPRRHLGLVLFSDTAYEALPPSTPVEGLEGWLELFRQGKTWEYPWAPTFAGGTAISKGLVLARRLLARDHVVHPHVILVSDLADSESDLQRLARTVAQYQRDRIDLRVIRVDPGTTPSTGSLEGLPNASFVAGAANQTIDPAGGSGTSALPIVLAVLVGLLALLAAANELTFHPLSWRTRT
jgi:hypothetical protein